MVNSKPKRGVVAVVIAGGLALLAGRSAQAGWVLIDDFQAVTTPASLFGAPASNGSVWTTGGTYRRYGVDSETLPGGSINKFMLDNSSGNSAGAGLAFGSTNAITQGTTGTVYFRLKIATDSPTGATQSIGMSRVGYPDFNTVVNFSNKTASIGLADTGLYTSTASATMSKGVWYNVWFEFDLTPTNAADDVFEIYVQRDGDPNYATRTLIGDANHMRSGAWSGSDGIRSFMMLAGNGISPKSYIDDLYVDTTGLNAANPTIPEPASLALLVLGGLMMIRGQKRFA